MHEGTLVLSSRFGRYAIGHCVDGPDLIASDRIAVHLADRWIPGTIEYDPDIVYERAPGEVAVTAEQKLRVIGGYYFHAEAGGSCGLCVGIDVSQDTFPDSQNKKTLHYGGFNARAASFLT